MDRNPTPAMKLHIVLQRMVMRILSVTLLMLMIQPAFSQTAILPFQKKFGGTQNEGLWRVRQLPDGNLIAQGSVNSGTSATADGLLVNFDLDGNILGSWTYGQPQQDNPVAIQVLPDGDVIVGGWYRPHTGSTRQNAYLSRISLAGSGQILWTRNFGTLQSPGVINGFAGQQLIITSDNRIVFVGHQVDGGSNTQRNAVLIKTDLNGNVLFRKSWTASTDLNNFKYVLEVDDGYVVTGFTDFLAPQETYYKAVVAKFSTNGSLVWSYLYDNGNRLPDNDIPIIKTPDGNMVLAFGAGSNNSINEADRDLIVMKIDQSGAPIWARRIGSPDYDDIDDMILGHNDEIIITGDIRGVGAGLEDGLIIRVDQSGNLIGASLYGGAQSDQIASIVAYEYGGCKGYIAVGSTASFNADGSNDGYILNLDSVGGDFGQCYVSNVPLNVSSTTFTTSQLGSVSDWNITDTPNLSLGPVTYNAQALGCSPVGSCTPVGIHEAVAGDRITLAPNPSPGRFELRVEGPHRLVSGQLLDALGREVALKRPLQAGAAVQQVEVDGQAKGVYLLQLVFADGGVSVARVVVE